MSVSGQSQELRCNATYPHALSLIIFVNDVDCLLNLSKDQVAMAVVCLASVLVYMVVHIQIERPLVREVCPAIRDHRAA